MNRTIITLLLILIVSITVKSQTFEIDKFKKDTINRIDKKGFKQGVWRKYYPNNTIKYEGTFKDNYQIGQFKLYYEQSKLQAISVFSEKGVKAKTTQYYENGKILRIGNFYNQEKDSLWKLYSTNSILIAEESYNKGIKTGSWKTYYLSGKIYENFWYQNNLMNGLYKAFFEDGKTKTEATYVNGEMDGKTTFYNSTGLILETGSYNKSLKNGEWLIYMDNGTINIKETYENGKLKKTIRVNGEFTDYYPSKLPKQKINYKNGKLNDAFTEYYDVGEWKQEFKKGIDGYPDETVEVLVGQKIKRTGTYLNDKLQGKVTYFKVDGTLEKIENYNNGVIITK